MNKTFKRTAAFLMSIVTVFGSSGIGLSGKPGPSSVSAAGQLLAFPGAVGGGKYATGGRGGEVYHVTNLNDSGAGSLRDAVSKSGRIVVFDVSGTIELSSNIICSSNITVAGQTAPGGSGVTLKNYKFGMGGDNIIVRYLSSRPGPDKCTSSGNDGWGGAKGSNSIIDHCSIGWTTDEQWGLYSNNEYYTVQYTVIGPANSWGGHVKGVHGFGLMMGKGYLTFDHNLIVHNVSRNFRGKVVGQETADFTNNVVYDWGYQTAYGTIGHLNYVNNTLKAGNSTSGNYHWMYVDSGTSPQNFKVYCAGNQLIMQDGSFHAVTNDNWSGVTLKDGLGITKDDLYSASAFQTLVNGENVSTATTCESAADSYEHVVSFAGNGISPDKRTKIDRQCADDAKNGTGYCSGTEAYDSSQSRLDTNHIQCGVTYEYPSAVLKKEIVDADNDGMDDDWELARGLDPSDPNDYKDDYQGLGYMNLEYYINDLTVDSFPEGVVTVSPESTPVPAASAFETIEAESYTSQEGIRTEDLSTGGQNIGFIENGDWAMYRKLDFGDGANSVKGLFSGNACTVELYTDSIGTTPAAKLYFPGTSGFSDYQEVSFNIPTISGTHNLYLKFTGGEGYLMNADSFVFSPDSIPLSGKLFTDVQVTAQANPVYWRIGTAAVGEPIFGDRAFTITQLQSNLEGAEVLLTSCDAKGTTGDVATFVAGADMTIHVALDSRVETAPDWLSDYVLMRSLLTSSNELTFSVYDKFVKKGETVTLGSNGQSYQCVNYFVLGTPSGEEPTTEPLRAIKGDANTDGDVNIADLVALARHIHNAAPLDEQGCENADLYEDRKINVFDLILMRQLVAGINE
ncbi:MAG: carbohydrate-binding protein [Ruminococcus sp.]|nr:carbohydrate-binding protein [Ruminococcus sp.]